VIELVVGRPRSSLQMNCTESTTAGPRALAPDDINTIIIAVKATFMNPSLCGIILPTVPSL
jgi:hypothetical protein